MNGPDQYQEAENLLKQAEDNTVDNIDRGMLIAEAQVRATLALAAATALAAADGADYPETSQARAWRKVLIP